MLAVTDEGQGLVDTGAEKCVLGADVLPQHLKKLEEQFGVKAKEIVTEPAVFRFANSKRETTTRAVELPIGIGGRADVLRIYIIPGSVPLLISRPVLSSLGGVLDLRTNRLTLHELGGVEVEMKTSRSGHLMIDLLDFPTAKQSAAEEQQGPKVSTADVTVFAMDSGASASVMASPEPKKDDRPFLVSANVMKDLGVVIQHGADGEGEDDTEPPLLSDSESDVPPTMVGDTSEESDAEPQSEDVSTVKVLAVQEPRGWRRFLGRKSAKKKEPEPSQSEESKEAAKLLPTKNVALWITDGDRYLVENVGGKKGPPVVKCSDREEGLKRMLARVEKTYGVKIEVTQCFQVWHGSKGDVDMAVRVSSIPTSASSAGGAWLTKQDLMNLKDEDLATRWGMLDATMTRLQPTVVKIDCGTEDTNCATVSKDTTTAEPDTKEVSQEGAGEKKRPMKRKNKKKLGKLSQMLMCLLTVSCGGWSTQEADAFHVEPVTGVCFEEWPQESSESWDHLESHPGCEVPDGNQVTTSAAKPLTESHGEIPGVQIEPPKRIDANGNYADVWNNLKSFREMWNGPELGVNHWR